MSDPEIEVAGDGTDELSGRALDALRDRLVPATLGTVDGVKALSTGGTATIATKTRRWFPTCRSRRWS